MLHHAIGHHISKFQRARCAQDINQWNLIGNGEDIADKAYIMKTISSIMGFPDGLRGICDVCSELADYILGYQRVLFPNFVLHDHIHARNVSHIASELADRFLIHCNPLHYTVLCCASLFHDIGMALPLEVINDLQLWEGDVKKEAPAVIDGLRRELGALYEWYFRNGVLKFPETSYSLQLSPVEAYIIRRIHPWLSALYITRYLPKLLRDIMPNFPKELLGPVSILAKWHSSKIDVQDQVIKLWGEPLELGKLAVILRLADSMDFSRARGKFVFQHISRFLLEKSPWIVRHWVYKLAVKSVNLRSNDIGVEIETDLPLGELEEKAALIGILCFEVIENFLADFETFEDKFGRMGLAIRIGGRKIDIKALKDTLVKCNQCLSKIKLSELKDLFSLCREIYNNTEEILNSQIRKQFNQLGCVRCV